MFAYINCIYALLNYKYDLKYVYVVFKHRFPNVDIIYFDINPEFQMTFRFNKFNNLSSRITSFV